MSDRFCLASSTKCFCVAACLTCGIVACTKPPTNAESEVVIPIPGTASGGEATKENPESYSVLTREESLGLAVLSLELRPSYGACRVTNPAAKPEISSILRMDGNIDCMIKDYQIAAMFCLAYVGENDDARLMEHILLTGHLHQSECFVRDQFTTAITALALMARRKIPEAGRIMADMVRPEFWKGKEFAVLQFDGLDPLEEDLVLATYATAIVNGSPDSELAARIIEGAEHRETVASFLEPSLVEKERLRIIEAEQQPVSDQMRALLQNHYRVLYLPLVQAE